MSIKSSILGITVLISGSLFAEEMAKYEVRIKDHKFNVSSLKVKANTKFELTVINEDKSAEEFESHKLKIEKHLGPNKTIKIILGPLKPGVYPFFGEFHEDSAKSEIVAE